jgi:MFS family permease
VTTTGAATGRLARMATAWRSGPLSVPAFRLLTVGQFTSTIGDYCYAIALPWLVLSNHGSADQLGIVLACYGIPRAALTTVGGSLADRVGPRLTMLCSDAARCALTAVFALFAADRISSLTALAPLAAVLGGCSALFGPASFAIMPSLLAPERLPSANAVYTGVVQVGSLLGPVIGGVLVATAGPTAAFGVDAASFLVSAASLALMAATVTRQAQDAASQAADAGLADVSGSDAAAGAVDAVADTESSPVPAGVWALLRRERVLQVILAVSVTANFALIGTEEIGLPALAHARFGAGGYGAVLACVAAASLVGTVIAARTSGSSRPAMVIAVVFVLAGVAIAAAPFIGGLPGLAAGMAVFGVSLGVDNVLSVTLIQQWAPPAMLGRVMGLLILAGAGTFPLSTAIAGLLVRHLGPSPVFVISGALLAAAVLAGLTQREFRDFGTTPQSARV